MRFGDVPCTQPDDPSGDSKNDMLSRIDGISFPDRSLLTEYLTLLEEAKKRDHKIIGPKLDLFSVKEEAPGSEEKTETKPAEQTEPSKEAPKETATKE